MNETTRIPKNEIPTADKFTDILWGLCFANAVLPLVDIAKEPRPFAEMFWRATLTMTVILNIFRNYYLNRKFLLTFHTIYASRYAKYRSTFTWIICFYIMQWFFLGACQYRPSMAAFSIMLIGASGLTALIYEWRAHLLPIKRRIVSDRGLDTLLRSEEDEFALTTSLRRIQHMYIWWGGLNGLCLLVGGIAWYKIIGRPIESHRESCLPWRGWELVPAVFLMLIFVADIIKNYRFYMTELPGRTDTTLDAP
jgi:hypothetical protein